MKKNLLLGASALAVSLAYIAPAQAANECGAPNTSVSPDLVSCIGTSGPYANGIVYNQGDLPTADSITIDVYGTVQINTVGGAAAIDLTGSANHNATIDVRANAQINSGGTALITRTSGTGNAVINNRVAVTGGTNGLRAEADQTGGSGSANITNNAGASVVLNVATGAAEAYGISGSGGSVNLLNNGSVTVNGGTGSAQIVGMAGRGFRETGSVVLTNNSTITMTGDGHSMAGMGVDLVEGSAQLINNGNISVQIDRGEAYGMIGGQSGDGSSVSVLNNGTVTVSATGADAEVVGLAAGAGAEMSIINQRTGATGGLFVNGGNATAFAAGGPGGVSIQNIGHDVTVTAGAGGSAAGVMMWNDGAQDVLFSDHTIGGTTYSGDLNVQADAAAYGITNNFTLTSGASNITLQGASLNVTGNEALGVLLVKLGDVSVTTMRNAATGNDAAITVTGASVANGVVAASLNGSSSINLGDSLTVSSTGTSSGAFAASGSGEVEIVVQDVTVSSADGEAAGLVSQSYGAGGVTLTTNGALNVTSGGDAAVGVFANNGTSQDISLNGAVTVQGAGGNSIGIDSSDSNGTVTIVRNGLLSVSATATGASATGIEVTNGGGLALSGADNIAVSADNFATGVYTTGMLGAQNATLGNVAVNSANGEAAGVMLSGAGAISLSANEIAVNAANWGSGIQLTSTGADSAIALNVNTVKVAGNGIVGIDLSQYDTAGSTGGINATARSVSVEGDGASGVGAFADFSTNVQLVLGNEDGTGGVTVNGANSTAVIANTFDGDTTIRNNGTVASSGAGSSGIVATANGAGNINIVSNVVSLTGVAQQQTGGIGLFAAGPEGYGIYASADTGNVSITAKNTSATANDAVHLISNSGNVGFQLGANGTATSTGGAGLYASAGNAVDAALGERSRLSGSTSGAELYAGGDLALRAGNGATVTGAETGIMATAGNDALIALGQNARVIGTNAGITTVAGGDSAVTLASGATVSGADYAISAVTGGASTITMASGSTATGTAGAIRSSGASHAITLGGTVTATGGPAVLMEQGAGTLVNTGTINGYIATVGGSTFTNNGTWNARGGTSSFGGSTLVNTGTINVNPGATAPGTAAMTGITTFSNSGTLSLANGQSGDVLDLGAATFNGTGNSRVVLDAVLAGNGTGADQLRVGSATGTTTIAINNLTAANSGLYNFSGLRLVSAANAANGTFVLDGGSVANGFAEYQLLADAAGNWNLVGVPSAQSFEVVRTTMQAQKFWRRSGDAWAEQMQAMTPASGFSAWGQFYAGNEKTDTRPTYSLPVMGTNMTFKPNLDMDSDWIGGQFGIDWGADGWGVGVTGGYADQSGKFEANGDELSISGGNVGVYARYGTGQGFYANALAKLDFYSVKYDLAGLGNSAPETDGKGYGLAINAGYRAMAGSLFVEPVAGISFAKADLDDLSGARTGLTARYEDTSSTFGHAGLRVGYQGGTAGGWTYVPYVGARWEGELGDQPYVTLTSGGTALNFTDAAEGGRARIEGGVQAGDSNGLSLFGKVEGLAGKNASGFGGRIGVNFRW